MTYRLPDLEIPADNPFQNDSLDREPVVKFLSKLIGRLDGPFVMAIDSPWGSGKTTLVRMLMEDLKSNEFQCIYFNAWDVDYVTDPLVSLVSSIESINRGAAVGHMKTVKKVATLLFKRSLIVGVKVLTMGTLDLGEEVNAAAAELASDTVGDIVDAFNKERELLDQFRTALTLAVDQLPNEGKKPKLVFFIDELDRCRPTFTIELLERVKHLFNVKNIIFVLSIDKQQLEVSTAAVYGASINSREYLRRFIDLEYGIPAANSRKYTESLITRFGWDTILAGSDENDWNENGRKKFIESFTLLSNVMELSLRARERCITRLRIVMDEENARDFSPHLVALLIVLRSNQPQLFKDFINGDASANTVMESILSLPKGKDLQSDSDGHLIHAHLLDVDIDHFEDNKRRLEMKSNDGGVDASERAYVNKVLATNQQRTLRVLDYLRVKERFARIAPLIDLAAMIK
ncbi:hypothetical protein D8B23_11175 [Verminephrobacter aporrectodeae subsp. tuberculatae]|uniref:KAP family P-loop NTPase fold protein n=1 Tax=Verminephrobacter aporrectodeae TaxID=1110389 RepID=UPI0022449BC5|nr:P-loop NTPase fold protein [Verminephrobacter aporrectodeae]MCW8198974.1 hypothetical protein [Verminephrobacter aporrectodeae subsp. tuberculatae]